MTSLMFKYISQIENFKNRVEQKYQSISCKKVTFTIESSYTWLGEVLTIRSNYGDTMEIFEEDDPIIKYHELNIDAPDQKSRLKLKIETHIIEKYDVDICKNKNGYYVDSNVTKRLVPLYFDSIDQLVDYYVENDEYYLLFDRVEDDDMKRTFETDLKER